MCKNKKTMDSKNETISCNETDLASVLYSTIMAAVSEEKAQING